MIDAPFALAFTAGMVATVNPCGFAMLPAYLSYFLGLESSGADGDLGSADPTAGVGRALLVAALSCTLPAFTGVVATTFGRESFVSGVATFVAYGLGMALLLVVLTLTLALARQGLVAGLRRALPHVHRVSGAIMALMGAYLVWYGIYEIRLIGRGEDVSGGPVSTVTDWSARLSDRLYSIDPLQAALVFGLIVSTAVLVGLLRSDHR